MTSTTIHTTEANLREVAGVNDILLAAGRVIFAVMFLLWGLQKFMDPGSTATMIASKGLPMPQALAIAAAALELGGGILIVIGWQTRGIALVLAIFTLVATFFFHDFWNMAPGMESMNNMIHAMKNLTIAGGFLMLAAVGAGRYSLDGPCTLYGKARGAP